MSKPIITVFGATAAQGGGLVRALLADPERHFAVRAVTRRPDSPAALKLAEAGAEVVLADIDDRASVVRALEGVYGAFLVTHYRKQGQSHVPMLPRWTARRRALAATYGRLLTSLVRPLPCRDEGHVYHLFVVRSSERDVLQERP